MQHVISLMVQMSQMVMIISTVCMESGEIPVKYAQVMEWLLTYQTRS